MVDNLITIYPKWVRLSDETIDDERLIFTPDSGSESAKPGLISLEESYAYIVETNEIPTEPPTTPDRVYIVTIGTHTRLYVWNTLLSEWECLGNCTRTFTGWAGFMFTLETRSTPLEPDFPEYDPGKVYYYNEGALVKFKDADGNVVASENYVYINKDNPRLEIGVFDENDWRIKKRRYTHESSGFATLTRKWPIFKYLNAEDPEEPNFDYTKRGWFAGMASIPDILSAKVKEEINGEFTAEITYHVTGINANVFKEDRLISVCTNQNGSRQLFRIQKIKESVKGVLTISAVHISYDIAGYAVPKLPDMPNNTSTLTPWSPDATYAKGDYVRATINGRRTALVAKNDILFPEHHSEITFENDEPNPLAPDQFDPEASYLYGSVFQYNGNNYFATTLGNKIGNDISTYGDKMTRFKYENRSDKRYILNALSDSTGGYGLRQTTDTDVLPASGVDEYMTAEIGSIVVKIGRDKSPCISLDVNVSGLKIFSGGVIQIAVNSSLQAFRSTDGGNSFKALTSAAFKSAFRCVALFAYNNIFYTLILREVKSGQNKTADFAYNSPLRLALYYSFTGETWTELASLNNPDGLTSDERVQNYNGSAWPRHRFQVNWPSFTSAPDFASQPILVSNARYPYSAGRKSNLDSRQLPKAITSNLSINSSGAVMYVTWNQYMDYKYTPDDRDEGMIRGIKIFIPRVKTTAPSATMSFMTFRMRNMLTPETTDPFKYDGFKCFIRSMTINAIDVSETYQTLYPCGVAQFAFVIADIDTHASDTPSRKEKLRIGVGVEDIGKTEIATDICDVVVGGSSSTYEHIAKERSLTDESNLNDHSIAVIKDDEALLGGTIADGVWTPIDECYKYDALIMISPKYYNNPRIHHIKFTTPEYWDPEVNPLPNISGTVVSSVEPISHWQHAGESQDYVIYGFNETIDTGKVLPNLHACYDNGRLADLVLANIHISWSGDAPSAKISSSFYVRNLQLNLANWDVANPPVTSISQLIKWDNYSDYEVLNHYVDNIVITSEGMLAANTKPKKHIMFNMMYTSGALRETPFQASAPSCKPGDFKIDYPKNLRELLANSIIPLFKRTNEDDAHYRPLECLFDNERIVLIGPGRGHDTKYEIAYKKNMEDFSITTDANYCYDAIYPYYYTEDQGFTDLTTLGEKSPLLYPEMLNDLPYYDIPRSGIYLLDLSTLTDEAGNTVFESAPGDVNAIIEQVKKFNEDNDILHTLPSFELKLTQLLNRPNSAEFEFLETLELGDSLSVWIERLEQYEYLRITALTYNPLTGLYEDMTIGKDTDKLTTVLAGIDQQVKTSKRQTTQKYATSNMVKNINMESLSPNAVSEALVSGIVKSAMIDGSGGTMLYGGNGISMTLATLLTKVASI